MTIQKLNSSTYNNFVKEGIVVIDFSAEWCGPCKMLAPVLEKLSEEYKEIKFAKVDVDKESELTQRFMVMGVPTVILYKNGKQVDRFSGYIPQEDFSSLIDKISK